MAGSLDAVRARRSSWLRSMAGVRLLVLDGRAGEPLAAALQPAGISVTRADRGSDGLVAYGRCEPDAVLLAPDLPDMPAAEVVASIKRSGGQPIFLGVGPDDIDAAGPAFLAGATTAVARPYDAHELLRRLAAELRDLPPRARLAFGPLSLDPSAHTVHIAGVELEGLPHKEFELLRVLMTHADQVVTTAEIQSTLWTQPRSAPSPNAVAVHANRLRHRLREPVVVRTVRGLGYRLTLEGRPRDG